jgi:hypothetical protein
MAADVVCLGEMAGPHDHAGPQPWLVTRASPSVVIIEDLPTLNRLQDDLRL